MNWTALTQLTKLIPGFELPIWGGTGGGCIQDGVFASHKLNIGPMGQMTKNNSRCITRGFNTPLAHASASKRSLTKVLSARTFTEFRSWAEMGSGHMVMGVNGTIGFENEGGDLHSIGHGGVGGEVIWTTLQAVDETLLISPQMGDPFNSVNDPLFWLHHTGMDRMWALWQEQDPGARALDVGTASSIFDLAPLRNDSPVWMGAMAPDVPALQVMDPLNRDGRGILCYKYEGLQVKDYLPTPKTPPAST
jgi:tyrosinase